MRVWVFAGVLCAVSVAHAEIYQWTDPAGTVHYSDRAEDVPPGLRRRIEAPERGAAGSMEPNRALRAVPAPASESNPPPQTGEAGAGAAAGAAEAEAALAALGALGGVGLGVALIVGLAALAVSVLVYAALILLGCRVLGYERPSFGHCVVIAGVQTAAYVLVSVAAVLLIGFSVQDPASLGRAQGAGWLFGTVSQVALFWAMWCESAGQAVILTIVVTLLAAALAFGMGLAAALLLGGAALVGGAG